MNHLRKLGYEIYLLSCGPVNSAWDRAYIIWAYLFGGTVDFGKAHSEKYHTVRFGHTFEHGVLEDLGKTDAHKKVNLVGHSFGGPTVKMINQLFMDGSEEERAVTPPEELSPLFAGGHANLIHTITTLDSDNNGTTVCDWAEENNHLLTLVNYLIAGFIAAVGETPLMKLYGMHAEQWGLMPDTSTLKKYRLVNLFRKRKEIANFANPNYVENNIMQEMRVKIVEEIINPKQRPDAHIYYFCQRADTLKPFIGNRRRPHLKMFFFCFLSGLVEGVYAPKFFEKIRTRKRPRLVPRRWIRQSAGPGHPFNAPGEEAELDFDRTYKAGIWYKMPPVHADHVY